MGVGVADKSNVKLRGAPPVEQCNVRSALGSARAERSHQWSWQPAHAALHGLGQKLCCFGAGTGRHAAHAAHPEARVAPYLLSVLEGGGGWMQGRAPGVATRTDQCSCICISRCGRCAPGRSSRRGDQHVLGAAGIGVRLGREGVACAAGTRGSCVPGGLSQWANSKAAHSPGAAALLVSCCVAFADEGCGRPIAGFPSWSSSDGCEAACHFVCGARAAWWCGAMWWPESYC